MPSSAGRFSSRGSSALAFHPLLAAAGRSAGALGLMISSRWKAASFALGVALVGTNAWWLYCAIDAGITATYREVSVRECEAQADQLEVIANRYVAGKPLREVQPFLFSTAEAAHTFPQPEEQMIVVGALALKLDPDNTVKSLVRDPYEP